MKKLIIIILFVCLSFAVCPKAKAADWTNGTFSCNIEITELGSWYAFWNWGKWQHFNVHFYVNSTPADALTFECFLGSADSTGFNCVILSEQVATAMKLNMNPYFQPNIPAGTSKNGACEIAYKLIKR